jgi:polysaccharide biosynthesis protein PslG
VLATFVLAPLALFAGQKYLDRTPELAAAARLEFADLAVENDGQSSRAINVMVVNRSEENGLANLASAPYVVVTAAGQPAPTPPGLAPPVGKSNPAFGVATGLQPLYYSGKKLAAYLDMIKRVGARYVRTDINLRQIFARPANANNGLSSPFWRTADRYVAAVQARGMKVLWILSNTPAWAAAPGYSGVWAPWASDEQFGVAARKVVKRYYRRGVGVYEIWNEPNYSWFFGNNHGRSYTDADVAKFGGMMRAAYRAMKTQAPGATVIGPGLGQAGSYEQIGGPGWMNEQRYLEKLYDPRIGNIKGHFDALSIHPYGDFIWGTDPSRYYDYVSGADDWVGWNKMFETNVSIRSIMVANGDGDKKIWATEIGAPAKGENEGAWTQGTGTTEAVQSEVARQVGQRWRSLSFAGGLMWYAGVDYSAAPVEAERWGLLRSDWSHKPAYASLRKSFTGAR